MRRRFRRRGGHEAEELNVTAFMNLMVVLVPFLLLMAVFSRVAIVELSLPPSTVAGDEAAPPLQLEVIVRADRILLADRSAGLLQELPNDEEIGYDLVGLSENLQAIKAQHPEVAKATLLLEPDISYENLVNIMDTVRMVPVGTDATHTAAELFPDIAVGDAPAAKDASGGSA